jgi:hypothetical protein
MKENTDSVEFRLRQALALYSRKSFDRDLISGTGGNLSVRIPGTNTALITPSGVSLADVEPDLNILVDLEGKVLKAPPGLKPSKETSFHLEVYRLRPEIHGLAHVHPAYSTAYANKGIALPLVTVSARFKNKASLDDIQEAWRTWQPLFDRLALPPACGWRHSSLHHHRPSSSSTRNGSSRTPLALLCPLAKTGVDHFTVWMSPIPRLSNGCRSSSTR